MNFTPHHFPEEKSIPEEKTTKSGAGFTHLHVHSHYSLLDGLPKIDNLLDYVKKLGMDSVALTDHGVLYGAVEFYKKAKKTGIKPIIGCLPPNHLIYTDQGVKPIKEVKVGDLALTHRGYFRKVTRVMVHRHRGYLYGIQAANSNTVWATGEHPILISDHKMNSTWVPAEKLKYGRRNRHGGVETWKRYALFPKIKCQSNKPLKVLEYLDENIYGLNGKLVSKIGKYTKYDCLKTTQIPAEIKPDQNFARLIGLFLAEGSYQNDSKGRPATIVFSFGDHEDDLVNFVIKNLKNLTHSPVRILHRPNKHLKEVYCSNTVLARFIQNLCGKGAEAKHVPSPLFKWPKPCLRKLWEGFIEGDGHIDSKTGEVRLRIKSRDLAWGMRLIAATLGYPGKVTERKKDGKVIYEVTWSPNGKYKRILENENYLLFPIKKVQKRVYNGLVYNFEVEKDHSYVSDIALHNCEMYMAYERMGQKRPNIDDKRYHLVLLVKNEEGYKNLVKLITKAHLEGFYYKPRIDDELLAEHSSGLIALSACLQGRIPKLILANKIEEAENYILKYQKIFGKDNFYLEIQDHPNLKEQKKANDGLIKLSKKLGAPLVATNDSHYLKPEDAEAQDVLMLINTGAKSDDPERLTMKADDFSMRTPQQMIESFKEVPEAIENTQKIKDLCNFNFKLGEIKLPHFETPSGKTPDDYLDELCQQGMDKKYGKFFRKEALSRLEYELSVIKQTGFASYFLIVQDFVNWAKENRIVVGPGRGSIGGSIVAYLLNITTIDPLKHNLLFERFLNPSRVSSMPDIDLDFTDRRRDEVINYVAEKYGRDKVAQIITFGTMAARAVIRDVGRAMKLSYSYCDRLAKMIPFGLTLKQCLEKVSEFRQFYDSDEQAKELIDFSQKLEGCARHASTHACGVVISKDPLDEIVPIQHPTQNDKTTITQYEMYSIEDLGLLKMDLLGLKNLTIIEDTLSRIYKVQNKKINIEDIPLDDKRTYKLLQEAQTTGVFQLESSGIKRYLKELKPTKFEDIVAMVALYRPGPIQFIPEYIERKHKRREIEYLHPKLKPILEDTQGICIFQEQLMQIAKDLAGFSLAEADVLRKAVGKKIKSLLITQKEKFIKGMIENGLKKEIAQKIWNWILPFARYGFNKAHSVAYGMIAYQTAYLKAHFPIEFMAALLTSEKTDVERIAFLIEECKDMKVEVLPPDINESFRYFSVVPSQKKIRFGLLAIKNVGSNVVEAIIKERKKGKFKSFIDFISRIDSKDLNKKSLESLAKTGAFDKFEERNKLLSNMEEILSFNREIRKAKTNGQKSLFDCDTNNPGLSFKLKDEKPAPMSRKLLWEKELLGLYISSHPLEKFKNILSKKTLPLKDLKSGSFPYKIRVGGIISSIKKILTKKGQPMLFVKLEDLTDKIEIVVFPSIIERNPTAFQENKVVFVTGKLENWYSPPKIICEEIEEIINEH